MKGKDRRKEQKKSKEGRGREGEQKKQNSEELRKEGRNVGK